MSRPFRVLKEDGEDLGFVLDCLYSGAISFDEFKEWLYLVIERTDEVPFYVFDILDLKNKFDFKPLITIGFVPHWDHTEKESDAINAIAYKRRPDYVSDAVSREEALKALEANPHIENRFRESFPFIDF